MADAPTDFGAILDNAAGSAGAPLQHTPAAFAQFYGPYADKVASQTGIDSNTILGQWGLETGWGKSVIPGTNNLGNIKSTKASGQGVSAKDNQTGSNDSYQKFGSLDDFADAYTKLLTGNQRYAKALGTGSDATATAQALKDGGYAEDAHYVPKLTNAAAQVAKNRQTDWGAILDGAAAQGSGQGVAVKRAPLIDTSGTAGYSGEPIESGSMLGGAAAGVGEGFGKMALGAQSLVGRGLKAVGADTAGDYLINDAQTGAANLSKQAADVAGTHTTARTIGNIAGAVAPALLAGPEVLPQALVGGAQGAADASLNNEEIAPAFLKGGALGGGAAIGGKVLGAAADAIGPNMRALTGAVRGGEDTAARAIANRVGADQLDSTIANLRANSGELIPGSLPTAAEAANNPAITSLQRGLANTAEGQVAFPARTGANAEARLNVGRRVVGDLDNEAEAYANAQAQRILAGQGELPPISEMQSNIMRTPAYQTAIAAAKKAASNAGVTTFDDSVNAANQAAGRNLTALTGDAADLEAAQALRSAEGRRLYGQIDGEVPLVGGDAKDLLTRPNVRQAIAQAATNDTSRLGSAAPDGITNVKPQVAPVQIKPQVKPITNPDGSRGFAEVTPGRTEFQQVAPGYQTASAQTLVGAKGILSDAAVSAGRAGEANKSDIARQAMSALDQFLEDNVPAYRAANDAWRANSIPVDRMQTLQKNLVGAIDPVTGEVSASKLANAISKIERDQLKPGLRASDRVSPQDLNQLAAISEQAARAVNTTTGVTGQGQEFLRQALTENAAKRVGQMSNADAVNAKQAFDRYLSNHSPSYRKAMEEEATTGVNLADRQKLSNILDKLDLSSNTATGVPQARFDKVKGEFAKAGFGADSVGSNYGNALIADLQRATTANAPTGAAGSQTAANLNLGGGLLGRMMGSKLGEHASLASLAHGNIIPAAAGLLAKKAFGQAQAKTEKAAIDLLLNPKKLADALEAFKGQPTAQQQFVAGLKQKASGAGAAGARALAAFNAASTSR